MYATDRRQTSDKSIVYCPSLLGVGHKTHTHTHTNSAVFTKSLKIRAQYVSGSAETQNTIIIINAPVILHMHVCSTCEEYTTKQTGNMYQYVSIIWNETLTSKFVLSKKMSIIYTRNQIKAILVSDNPLLCSPLCSVCM